MYGKDVPTPRKLSSMMDPAIKLDATGTGTVWNSETAWVKAGRPWSRPMLALKQRVEALTGQTVLYAQLNHYSSAVDYIGYHTDSEVQEGDVVASISLGATRRFVFRDRRAKSGPPACEFTLRGGSLVLFDYEAAHLKWKHSVPKVRKCDGYVDEWGWGRINITFRNR